MVWEGSTENQEEQSTLEVFLSNLDELKRLQRLMSKSASGISLSAILALVALAVSYETLGVVSLAAKVAAIFLGLVLAVFYIEYDEAYKKFMDLLNL